jgi:hypothetical protein
MCIFLSKRVATLTMTLFTAVAFQATTTTKKNKFAREPTIAN